MKMTNINNMKNSMFFGTILITKVLFLAVFCLFPLYGQETRRTPININLIIDGSNAFTNVRDEVTSWVNTRFDQIAEEGDRVTIWSAGLAARVIYSGTINSASDKDAAKRSIREFSVSGNVPDFSGALREAAELQSSSYSYTLLISTSGEALSTVISGPQANLLRFSRIEEFSSWRALVVGLNIDTRVRRATNAYFGS